MEACSGCVSALIMMMYADEPANVNQMFPLGGRLRLTVAEEEFTLTNL